MENKKTSFHKFMDATSGVKVELSVIDDLKKVISIAEKHIALQKENFGKSAKVKKAQEEYYIFWNKIFDEIQNAKEDSESIKGQLSKYILTFENSSKDLGINPSTIKEYSAAMALLDTITKNDVLLTEERRKLDQYT